MTAAYKRADVAMRECDQCGRRWQNNYQACPYCGHLSVRAVRAAGAGCVYSWVEIHRSFDDPTRDVPYVVVAVDLDDGGRAFGRLLPGGAPRAGAKVVAVSDKDETAPAFVGAEQP